MIMHRPIPPGAVIKVATVSRRRRDCRSWDWRLHVTVDVTACVSRRSVPETGAVALNLGFAVTPRGIRSGYLVGSDGAEQEVLVVKSDNLRGRQITEDDQDASDHWISGGLAKADAIHSHRDKILGAMKASLSAWKARDERAWLSEIADLITEFRRGDRTKPVTPWNWGNPPPPVLSLAEPPEWFVKITESLHAWRSPDRFRRLAAQWSESRFEGDGVGYELLRAWCYRDEHLERYESGLRRSALADRREGYRILASRMAQRYHTLIIDDLDLRDFQRSPPIESEEGEIPAVKRNQRMAACSELRSAMMNAFGPDRVVKQSGRDQTRTCFECGAINDWDRVAGDRVHACSGCMVRWDQDANFCRNQLREYQRAPQNSETARADKEAKRKPSRSERLAQARKRRVA
jgi:hypothetical protein